MKNKSMKPIRPIDYYSLFQGNVDETFRIGIQIKNKKNLILFSDFDYSDIIIASPLGFVLFFILYFILYFI